MHKRFVILLLIVFSYSPNLVSAQPERAQIRWFIQAANDEGGLDSAFIQYVNAYNQSQDSIEVIMDITTATCSFDAADTLLARIAKGIPPDITSLSYSALWDHLLDLTPYLKNYDLSQMDTTRFQKFRSTNGLIYLPLGYYTDLLFYNRDMFDRAGVPYPPHSYDSLYADGEEWNADKLLQIGSLLTLDQNGRNANHPEFDPNHIVQYGFHWGWNNGIGFLGMFGSPHIVNPDGSITIPQYMRDGYHWSHEGIWQRHFIPSIQVFMDTMQGDPLGSGRTAMALAGSWYCLELDDTLFHWDIAAIPSYNGTHNVCWEERVFGVLNTTQHPEEALEVIMTIANTIDFYIMNGPAIPTKNNLRTEVLDRWRTGFPNIDRQVILDGLDYRNPLTSSDAIRRNMSAWRIMNDFRDYIWSDPSTQIDGGINDWLIPHLENIFQSTSVKNSTLNDVPCQYRLDQNYPNPFNSSTKIVFELPKASEVELHVFDVLGRHVRALVKNFYTAGTHEVLWEGNDDAGNPLCSGIYFIQMQTDRQLFTRKMLLLK